MKKNRILSVASFALAALFVSPAIFTGCGTPPGARVVQVQSLKAAGHTAESAVALSAQLFRDGKISAGQARDVLDFYNTRFQPVFRLAVQSANSNLDSVASPDLLSLASQLSSLVASFSNK